MTAITTLKGGIYHSLGIRSIVCGSPFEIVARTGISQQNRSEERPCLGDSETKGCMSGAGKYQKKKMMLFSSRAMIEKSHVISQQELSSEIGQLCQGKELLTLLLKRELVENIIVQIVGPTERTQIKTTQWKGEYFQRWQVPPFQFCEGQITQFWLENYR